MVLIALLLWPHYVAVSKVQTTGNYVTIMAGIAVVGTALGAFILWVRHQVKAWQQRIEQDALDRANQQEVVRQQQADLAKLMINRTKEIQNGDSKSTLVRIETSLNELKETFVHHLDDSRKGFDRLAVVEDYINNQRSKP